MSDPLFFGLWILGALSVWFGLALLAAAAWARTRTPLREADPWVAYFLGAELPITRPDLDAAHTAIATAEAIVRAEYEAAS